MVNVKEEDGETESRDNTCTVSSFSEQDRQDRPYCCYECYKTFATLLQLKEHMYSHRDSSVQLKDIAVADVKNEEVSVAIDANGSDNICTSRSRAKLSGSREQDRPYCCFECCDSFETLSRLKAHVKTHRDCGLKSKKNIAQEDSATTDTDGRGTTGPSTCIGGRHGTYRCCECCNAFDALSQPKAHQHTHVQNADAVADTDDQVSVAADTDSCGNRCPSQRRSHPSTCDDHGNQTVHSYGAEPRKRLTCDVCRREFSECHHPSKHPGYICGSCSRKFVCLSQLKAHQCSSRARRCCDSCRRRLGGDSRSDSCSSEPGHVCGVCRREFPTAWQLRSHSRTHVDQRPFTCELCRRRFFWSGRMRRHVSIHPSEAPPSYVDPNYHEPVRGLDVPRSSDRSEFDRTGSSGKYLSPDSSGQDFREQNSQEMDNIEAETSVAANADSYNANSKDPGPVSCGGIRSPSDGRSEDSTAGCERSFICGTCGRHLDNSVAPGTHVCSHRFPCPVCSLKFSDYTFLKMHMYAHGANEPFYWPFPMC